MDFGKEHVQSLLEEIKEGGSVTRNGLQNLIDRIQEEALKDNLDNTESRRSVKTEKEEDFSVRDSYMMNRPSLNDDGSTSSNEKELTYLDRIRHQFEKFMRDIELINVNVKNKKLTSVLENMDRFNDDLGRLVDFITERHQQDSLKEKMFEEQKGDLEFRIADLKKDLEKQFAINSDMGEELTEMRIELAEVHPDTKNDRITGKNQADDLLIEIGEYSAKVRDLEDTNAQLESELNQKYMDINELKSEIKSLTDQLARIMEIDGDIEADKRKEELGDVFRNSVALRNAADQMGKRRGSVNSSASMYKERVQELEEELDEERNFLANMKMEMSALKSKNEDLEDQLLAFRREGQGGIGRLDSNIFGMEMNLDHGDIQNQINDDFMSMEFGKQTTMRRVRDHKCIQVDLAMANVIMEEYELDFEVKSVKIEKILDEITKVSVIVINDEEVSEAKIKMDKVMITELGKKTKNQDEALQNKIEVLKKVMSDKDDDLRGLQRDLKTTKTQEKEFFEQCVEIQNLLENVGNDGKIDEKKLAEVKDKLKMAFSKKKEASSEGGIVYVQVPGETEIREKIVYINKEGEKVAGPGPGIVEKVIYVDKKGKEVAPKPVVAPGVEVVEKIIYVDKRGDIVEGPGPGVVEKIVYIDQKGEIMPTQIGGVEIIEKIVYVNSKGEVVDGPGPGVTKKIACVNKLGAVVNNPMATDEIEEKKVFVNKEGEIVDKPGPGILEKTVYVNKQGIVVPPPSAITEKIIYINNQGEITGGPGPGITEKIIYLNNQGEIVPTTVGGVEIIEKIVYVNSEGEVVDGPGPGVAKKIVYVDKEGEVVEDPLKDAEIEKKVVYMTKQGDIVDGPGDGVIEKIVYVDRTGEIVPAVVNGVEIREKIVYVNEGGEVVDGPGPGVTQKMVCVNKLGDVVRNPLLENSVEKKKIFVNKKEMLLMDLVLELSRRLFMLTNQVSSFLLLLVSQKK